MRAQIATAKAAGALSIGVSSRAIGVMAAERPQFVAALAALAPQGLLPVAGGLIIFDNMLSHGGVVRPQNPREAALDAHNLKLAADPRVESVLVPIADGLMICKKK